jgi:hypothetical protein
MQPNSHFTNSDFKILRPNSHIGQVNQPNIEGKKKSKWRTVRSLDKNLTPSTANIINLAAGIREHGGKRVEVWDYVVQQIHGIAVRSDGSVKNVEGIVKGAHLQHGRGSKIKKTHAAHVHPLAGFEENWKELSIEEMFKEKVISPRKKAYLKKVGATPEQIQDLMYHLDDKAYLKKKMQELAPGPSVFSNTLVEEILNTTDELPESVNLEIDCKVERKIRKEAAKVMVQAMKAEITVVEARHMFVTLVHKGLEATKEVIQHQLKRQMELELEEEAKFIHLCELLGYVNLEIDGTVQASDILDQRDHL